MLALSLSGFAHRELSCLFRPRHQVPYLNEGLRRTRLFNLSLSELAEAIPGSGIYQPTDRPLELGKLSDEQAFDCDTIVVAGAGNDGADPRPEWQVVTSPANGLNTVAIGGTFINDTRVRTDDSVIDLSSWRNPAGVRRTRIKPELVAPALGVFSSDFNPFGNQPYTEVETGTSLSSPMATGTVGLILQRQPNIRFDQVRALLMASAFRLDLWNNFAGEKEGAGTLAAEKVMGNLNLSGYTQLPATCPTSGTSIPLPGARFYAITGSTVKVAISFASLPMDPTHMYIPTADLDVFVVRESSRPSAADFMAYTGSLESNTEVVSFRAPTDGWYYMGVKSRSCSRPPRGIGWAVDSNSN
jgi:Subtilase family